MEFCSGNMDAWYFIRSVACDTMEFDFILFSTYVGVVHFTWPSWAMWHMRAPTFNKWHKKKKKSKNMKVTLHILTYGAIRGCELICLVACINDKNHDIRERIVTIRSEIWTTYICSDVPYDKRYTRKWVILWRLILWSLRCIGYI